MREDLQKTLFTRLVRQNAALNEAISALQLLRKMLNKDGDESLKIPLNEALTELATQRAANDQLLYLELHGPGLGDLYKEFMAQRPEIQAKYPTGGCHDPADFEEPPHFPPCSISGRILEKLEKLKKADGENDLTAPDGTPLEPSEHQHD